MATFAHLETADFEIVLNAENISYVQKMGNSIFINFVGGGDRLHLRKEPGQAAWKLVRNSAVTIYQESEQSKKAESSIDKSFQP